MTMKVNWGLGAWEKIIKNSLDIICTTDKEGYFLNINEACERILGYECKEMIGRHFSEFLCPEDLPGSLRIARDIVSGYKTTSFENRLLHKKGPKVPIIWSAVWSEQDQVSISVGRNVTEQKLVEKKEELQQALVEHGSDMLALLDEELNCLGCEGAILRGLGYLPEQLTDTNALSYIHPEDIPFVKDAITKLFASKGHLKIPDFRFKDAKGEWKWLETTVSYQLDNPLVKALVASSIDITERINTRLKLQENEQRFKSLFDHHLDIVLFQNREGIMIDANAATLAFFGLQRQDILNKPFSDFIPPEIVPLCDQTLQEALNGEPVRFEIAIPFEGKGLVDFEIAKIPVIVDGETIGVYSILRDITEITRSNATIRQQATKLNAILESITDAFFTLDRKANLTYVNQEFERLFSIDRKKLLGKNFWTLVDERMKQQFYGRYDHALSTGRTAHFETYLARHDKWLQVKVYPSEEGVSVFLDDISFRKEAEANQRRLTQDLYKQNQDLQQFTYIVSHNLRAPVATAMGLSNLLTFIDKDSDTFNVSLGYLSTSIRNMDTVLKDLNKVLSIRNNNSQTDHENVQLAPVCRQAEEDLCLLLKENGGEVLTQIREDMRVRGNKVYLYSIFYNLLSNSIKYRSPKRPLKINIESVDSPEWSTIISFSDNGSGFDMNLASGKVFQLYKRFHANSDGRGMGLFLVKTHLETMGGHIEVTSQVNVGTRFLIYLK